MKSAVRSLLLFFTIIVPLISFPSPARSQQCISVPKSCDTRGGGWSMSEFPHAVVNGCDYVENIFLGVSGQVLNLLSVPDLTPACNVHDRCYYSNAGESAETCNRRFYESMLEICQKKYSGLDLLNMARLRLCNIWVAEIAETVNSVADLEANFPRARKSQRDYMKYIKATCKTKTWDPYPCTTPQPSECRQTADGKCCRKTCERSCTKGESKWQWQCSE